MKPLGYAAAAFAVVAAVLGGLWWKADRVWLEQPPPGRWTLVVRLDGADYLEGLATHLMLDLTKGSGRGHECDVNHSRRPKYLWVRHVFAPRPGDDGDAMLERARGLVGARMSRHAYPWRIAWIDDHGRVVR